MKDSAKDKYALILQSLTNFNNHDEEISKLRLWLEEPQILTILEKIIKTSNNKLSFQELNSFMLQLAAAYQEDGFQTFF